MGVPVFALLYAIVRTICDKRLKANGLPVESSAYARAPEKIGKVNGRK